MSILPALNELGLDTIKISEPRKWHQEIEHFVVRFSVPGQLSPHQERLLLDTGRTALLAFLQSNVTGPPLDWNAAKEVFPRSIWEETRAVEDVRRDCISRLSVDGIAAYQLTPNVELFSLALILFNASLPISESTVVEWRWEKLRVNFWHQRMLSEVSDSLQRSIYQDLEFLDSRVLAPNHGSGDTETKVQFLLERAAIHTFHGFDVKARSDLGTASRLRRFAYQLTGRLGKRTKFQEKDLSQLVVLAKSVDEDTDPAARTDLDTGNGSEASQAATSKPENLDLNDDTLLESISFSKPKDEIVKQMDSLPESLKAIDPSNQPILKPYDSIILLSFASSITNTSPEDGLTREETLPYAIRVLDGGSSNWQIYTQALLVRSRIEGYRSRTVERGVLQLQALVDQVIADTTPDRGESGEANDTNGTSEATPSTFLPRPKPSESAPAAERLQYIHALAPPTRWTLEAELAARWVSLGGLRTALEIYERLHMWAEAALCWAAVEHEDRARKLVRRQLFGKGPAPATPDRPLEAHDDAEYLGTELSPLPADAPRLLCILGDLEKDTKYYERAWSVSNNRYARAQRALGKHYLSAKQLSLADEAYSLSLKINPQNQSTWFALGCVRLELRNWNGAVQAFSRSVQIEEGDAEAWSNLAAALLRLSPSEAPGNDANVDKPWNGTLEDDEDAVSDRSTKQDAQIHVREAFTAFKRAAKLKRNSHRIWQNVLNVGVTLSPPPYADIVQAQQRLIELRGTAEGESCVDVEAMEGLLAHVIATTPSHASASRHANISEGNKPEPTRRKVGLEHMFGTLLRDHIVPLITFSRRLWLLAARFAMHQHRPSSALEAYEKAWRTTLQKPGWDGGGSAASASSVQQGSIAGDDEEKPQTVWEQVVDATIELVDAYESLGGRERTEGLGAGQGGEGEVVCRQWKFKARSAVRGVMGRGKEVWEGSEGWERLRGRMEELKGGSGG